jgi:hypothetical protein
VLLLGALVTRLEFNHRTPYHAINDAGTYNRMASMIANHGDYHTGTKPRSGAGGSRGPTAYFPPAFPYLLAFADLLDGHSAGGRTAVPGERTEMAILGTISVGLVGLVALEAFGELTALIALAIAAFYPVFVELSGTLVAENLELALELLAAWTLLRARRARAPYRWLAATGLCTGLAALTHENAILFVVPFAIAAWRIAPRRPNRTRPGIRALAAPTILIICTCIAISPWTIRNAVELHAFIPVADETGITLLGTYNASSANDPELAYKWHLFSNLPEFSRLATTTSRYSENALNGKLTGLALDYISAHPLAPIEVAFDNTRRMLELEGTYAWHASARAVGLTPRVAEFGVGAFYLLAIAALIGAFTPRARRGPWWLWAMPVLWWLSIVPVNVETPRFREPIDAFVVLLAACAIGSLIDRLGLGGAPVGRRRGAAGTTGGGERVEVVERPA